MRGDLLTLGLLSAAALATVRARSAQGSPNEDDAIRLLGRGKRRMLSIPHLEPLEVRQIGKGMFSTAYAPVHDDTLVYLVTHVGGGGGDWSKTILAELARDDPSPHLPSVEHVGEISDGCFVYRMPRYKAPLRKAGTEEAWRAFRAIQKCWSDADDARVKRSHRSPHDRIHSGYVVMSDVVACAEASPDVPETIVEALRSLAGWSSNYGASYSFEFSPRNLATDGNGNLILLDVVYDMEAVEHKRAIEHRKNRGW